MYRNFQGVLIPSVDFTLHACRNATQKTPHRKLAHFWVLVCLKPFCYNGFFLERRDEQYDGHSLLAEATLTNGRITVGSMNTEGTVTLCDIAARI